MTGLTKFWRHCEVMTLSVITWHLSYLLSQLLKLNVTTIFTWGRRIAYITFVDQSCDYMNRASIDQCFWKRVSIDQRVGKRSLIKQCRRLWILCHTFISLRKVTISKTFARKLDTWNVPRRPVNNQSIKTMSCPRSHVKCSIARSRSPFHMLPQRLQPSKVHQSMITPREMVSAVSLRLHHVPNVCFIRVWDAGRCLWM